MATRKNPKVVLPKQWTTAQVRVNPQGKVQVKIAKNKVKQNGLFDFGSRSVTYRKGADGVFKKVKKKKRKVKKRKSTFW